MQTLRNAAAGRELELQRDYQAVVERQQGEIESLREELESSRRNGGEAQGGAQGGQGADGETRARSEEDARGQARRGERGVGQEGRALQAQREADNRALRARHAEETARLGASTRSGSRPRTSAGRPRPGRSKSGCGKHRVQRETELRAYTARLKELEAARLAQKSSAKEDLERVVERFGAEISALENRITELQEALEEADAAGELEAFRRDPAGDEELSGPAGIARNRRRTSRKDLLTNSTRRRYSPRRGPRISRRGSRGERGGPPQRLRAEEAPGKPRALADPERRLREGIALFNASEHASTVASISKAFGLPRVHAATDVGTQEARRHVRVGGDGLAPVRRGPHRGRGGAQGLPHGHRRRPGRARDPSAPNARMDARGRLTLGVQAR